MERPGRKPGAPHSSPGTALLSQATSVVRRIAQTTSRRGRLSALRAARAPLAKHHQPLVRCWEVRIKRHFVVESSPDPNPHIRGEELPPAAIGELPNRLLTAFDVAKFVACPQEPVRPPYLPIL